MELQSYQDLERILSIPASQLQHLASSIDENVKFGPKVIEGKIREICDPSNKLKKVQRLINKQILQKIPLPGSLYGSVMGKSPKINAEQHKGKPFVYGLDIKDFYPSIHFTRVQKLLLSLGYSSDVASLLTRLTTYKGSLAQGFPTSSTLANLILAPITPRIQKLCNQHRITFTFYQDDLTISGGYRIPNLVNLFTLIMKQEGFTLHHLPKKKRPMPRTGKQEVTGYVINHKVNVPKEYYRNLRMTLHLCKVKGIEMIAGDVPVEEFKESIFGKIQYVLEVNPARGQKLLDEFQSI
ncbi:MAG: RNA-directed DNA polymerase [Chloroflexi bacterium]|nr:RNA-directed DNA polymerase [Chloroflexota bacterium]